MYTITKAEWSKLVARHYPDYIDRAISRHEHDGKVCEAGEWTCFECLLPGAPNTGTTLVFQHIHFEII